MRRLVLTVAMVLVGSAPAQAVPTLGFQHARKALEQDGRADVRDGFASSYAIPECHRVSRLTIGCTLVEPDVDWAGDVGEMTWFPLVHRTHRGVVVRYPGFL